MSDTESKQPEWDTGPRSYDPVENAMKEGQAFGKGVASDYRHTWITRIGFFLLGLPFLVLGLTFGIGILHGGVPAEDSGWTIALILMLLMAIAACVLGLLLMRSAFRRGNNSRMDALEKDDHITSA